MYWEAGVINVHVSLLLHELDTKFINQKDWSGHFREEAENLQLLFMHDDGQKQIVSDRSTD